MKLTMSSTIFITGIAMIVLVLPREIVGYLAGTVFGGLSVYFLCFDKAPTGTLSHD